VGTTLLIQLLGLRPDLFLRQFRRHEEHSSHYPTLGTELRQIGLIGTKRRYVTFYCEIAQGDEHELEVGSPPSLALLGDGLDQRGLTRRLPY
jgi:hypothetical protein